MSNGAKEGWEIGTRDSATRVHNRRELEVTLQRYASERGVHPYEVRLFNPVGGMTSFGVGMTESYVWIMPSSDPPYFTSVGAGTPGSSVMFEESGDTKPVDGDTMVPWDGAREAILHYFETGKLSTAIAWEKLCAWDEPRFPPNGPLIGWMLDYGYGERQPLGGPQDLVRALEPLERHRTRMPIIVTLEGPPGVLGFGAGQEETSLNWLGNDNGDPPYYSSRGAREPGGAIDYWSGGHHTPLNSESMVPWPAAKRALMDYLTSGKLSAAVEWMEV